MDIRAIDHKDYDVCVDLYIPEVYDTPEELYFNRDDNDNVLLVSNLHVGTLIRRIQHGLSLFAADTNSDLVKLEYHLPALVLDAESGTNECGDFVIDQDDAEFYLFSELDGTGDDTSIWCVVHGMYASENDMEFKLELKTVLELADNELKRSDKKNGH